ncbi:F-box protein At3g07870-like [Papaver somniferum]|uniref:F-box protein At3g07870-like n=1 Tax=Papaver somniferum TaxID=3469 RepID=UPI000E701912|nr:F-box protein At3g07870-like [Papaver somniferum]
MEYDDENREKPLKFGITNLIPVPDHNLHEIIGSCNGLICLSACSNNDPIYICNPMTREFVCLPKLTKKFRPRDYVVSGFGFDPCANEYKVVRIYFGRVYVYTLGSGQGWRTLKDITYKLHPSVSNEILWNGALHWFDKDGKIVKFAISDETFSVLPTQEYVDEMKKDDLSKNKKNRTRLPDNENRKQDIEESSWSWEQDTFDWQSLDSKKRTSELYPVAILKDNTKILFHDNYCNYYRQNLAGMRFKIIAGDRSPHDSVRYMKSFVSLKALGEKEAKLMKSSK